MPLPPNFETLLSHIERLKDPIQDLHSEISQTSGHQLSPYDTMVAAAASRALSLCDGYAMLARAQLYTTAASLPRLQLDSCLRLYAGTLVEDRQDFAAKVLQGERVDQLRDRTGRYMRDGRLAKLLAKEHHWVPRAYRETSDFIHLSPSHVDAAIPDLATGTPSVPELVRIEAADPDIDPDEWTKSAELFRSCTRLLLRTMGDWLAVKRKH